MTAATASVWGAGLLCVAAFTVWRIVEVICRHYRHHRCANKRFMAGYRAGYRAVRPRLITVYPRGIRTVHEDATQPFCDYLPPPGSAPVRLPAARPGHQFSQESRCA